VEFKFIGDRSGILGTVGKKMTKIGQKLIKIAQNRVVFVHFPYLFF